MVALVKILQHHIFVDIISPDTITHILASQEKDY